MIRQSANEKIHLISVVFPIINAIRALSKSIKTRVAKETNSDYEGAYDVELGFKDNKLWLFQIRPFVEWISATFSFLFISFISVSSLLCCKTLNVSALFLMTAFLADLGGVLIRAKGFSLSCRNVSSSDWGVSVFNKFFISS